MKRVFCLIISVFTILLSGCSILDSSPNYINENKGGVTVFCFDVGQADCSLITTDDTVILIDAGNRNDGNFIVDFLQEQNIETIDYLVATHPHEDHIGGMSDIFDNFKINNVYMPKISKKDIPTTKVYEDFIDSVMEEECKVVAAKGGETVIDENNLKFETLAPNSTNYGELNNYSVVTKLSFHDTEMLFMGDAENEIEKEILSKKYNIRADIIKIGHHGSDSSSSKKFITKTKAKDTIISCGLYNNYNHPSEKTLNLLENLDKSIYRTDYDGSIIISIDSNGYKITNDKKLRLNGGK